MGLIKIWKQKCLHTKIPMWICLKDQLKVSGVLDPQIWWIPSLHRGWEIHQWQKIWTDFFQVCMKIYENTLPGLQTGEKSWGMKALEWFDRIPRRDQALMEPRCQITLKPNLNLNLSLYCWIPSYSSVSVTFYRMIYFCLSEMAVIDQKGIQASAAAIFHVFCLDPLSFLQPDEIGRNQLMAQLVRIWDLLSRYNIKYICWQFFQNKFRFIFLCYTF